MKTIICIFVLTLSIFAVSASEMPEQKGSFYETKEFSNAFQNRNSITGFVFGESRTPVPNVYVELMNDTYSPITRVRTNESGLYFFRGLTNSTYIIKVLTAGTDYEEQTTSVSFVPISPIANSGAMSEQIDFYLRAKKRRNVNNSAAPGVLFVQEVPDAAKKLYESGINELADKKEDLGLAKIKQAIEIFPDYFMALERLGNEYLNRGYYQPASVLFTKAVVVNPRSFSSSFGLGLATYRLNQTDEAIKCFRDSVTKSSNSINAHLWLGIALHSKNEISEALDSLLQANKLSEGTAAEVHWQLARVYKDQKKFNKAADELELFLKYKPDAKNFNEIKQVVKTLRGKN